MKDLYVGLVSHMPFTFFKYYFQFLLRVLFVVLNLSFIVKICANKNFYLLFKLVIIAENNLFSKVIYKYSCNYLVSIGKMLVRFYHISVQSMVSFMVKTKVVDHFIVVYFLSLFLVQNRI